MRIARRLLPLVLLASAAGAQPGAPAGAPVVRAVDMDAPITPVSALRITKAIDLPSGDQSNALTDPFSVVICSASPPATRMRKTCDFPPLRPERNPIQCPSGDQAGAVEDLSPRVSWNAPVPSAFET